MEDRARRPATSQPTGKIAFPRLVPLLLLLFGGLAPGSIPATATEPLGEEARLRPPRQGLLLEGGHRFDVERGGFVPNRGLLIRGGKILSVFEEEADGSSIPSGALRIHLEDDAFILPGLFDVDAPYVMAVTRRPIGEATLTPLLYLAHGVTSTLTSGREPEATVQRLQRIRSGHGIGPRIFFSSPPFGKNHPGWNRELTREEIRHFVERWASRGVSSIRVESLPLGQLETIVAAAHDHSLTVTHYLDLMHPPDLETLQVGVDRVGIFVPCTPFEPPSGPTRRARSFGVDVTSALCRFVAEQGTAIIPNLFETAARFKHYLKELDPEVEEVLARMAREVPDLPQRFVGVDDTVFTRQCFATKAFHKAGTRLVVATSHLSRGRYLPGRSYHHELELLGRAFLPASEVIVAATLNGARSLGKGDLLGSIEPGKLADLYVVRGNPLEDLTRLRAGIVTVKSGVPYDCAKLLAAVSSVGQEGEESGAESDE